MAPIGIGLSLANLSSGPVPLQVPDLAFWVRADLGITLGTGTNVSTWADQSGSTDPNHILYQLTTARQPTLNVSDPLYNNQNTLSFSRANDTSIQNNSNWAVPLSEPSTIYAVANSDGMNVYYENVFDGNDSDGGRQQLYFIAGFWSITAGGVNSGPTTNSTAAPSVFCCVYDGTSSKLYISAATDSPLATTPPVSPLSMMVLGNARGGGLGLQGTIAEVAAYSGSHDAPTRAKIMTYLGKRYGITIGV